MTQNTLTKNVETAAEVIKEVKEAIIEKGVEIPEGTHATQYPGYIAKMTSQTELEEFKEQVVLKGVNESEVKVSAPVIELNATEDSASGLSLEAGDVNLSGKELKASLTGDILLETAGGNIDLNPTTEKAQYKGVEIATVDNITSATDNYLPLTGGRISGSLTVSRFLYLDNSPNQISVVANEVQVRSAKVNGILLQCDAQSGNIDLNPGSMGVVRYKGNEVATIATFTTDSEAEAYSISNPTVLVISTQQ